MPTYFYDTSALLNLRERAFDDFFYTSSVVLQELENIKTSRSKTESIRQAARCVVRLFNETDNYAVVFPDGEVIRAIANTGLEVTNDTKIVSCAKCEIGAVEDLVFVTDDILLRLIAKYIFDLPVERCKVEDHRDDYKGFRTLRMTEDEMARFYSHPTDNVFECITNEYAVVMNTAGEPLDILKWTGSTYAPTIKKTLKTFAFGDKIRPKDEYQQMVIDSILSNTITVISGRAGSGKSLLSLVAAMHLIETGKYSRLVILFNPTTARGASKLGFYAGDMIGKAMQTSIGNILTSKLGDRYAVDVLIQQNKLKLVSMADARGFEVQDDEILYITEAQNADIDLMKLAMSRASQGAKIIVEGDTTSQVDDAVFEGRNNGMRRLVEILKGEDLFGYVELQNVWRSKIAALVDKM